MEGNNPTKKIPEDDLKILVRVVSAVQTLKSDRMARIRALMDCTQDFLNLPHKDQAFDIWNMINIDICDSIDFSVINGSFDDNFKKWALRLTLFAEVWLACGDNLCTLESSSNHYLVSLDVCGLKEEYIVTMRNVWSELLPLTLLLHSHAHLVSCRRLIVGLCGCGGSGKTAFSKKLEWISQKFKVFSKIHDNMLIRNAPSPEIIALSLDGYHFPNAFLDSHYCSRNVDLTLLKVKGTLETMNVVSLIRDMKKLRGIENEKQPDEMERCKYIMSNAVLLPLYDRIIHDPREDAIKIDPPKSSDANYSQIIIVEGLYTLERAHEWAELDSLIDFSILLWVPEQISRERIIGRKVKSGRTLEEATDFYYQNDANTRRAIYGGISASQYSLSGPPANPNLTLSFDTGSDSWFPAYTRQKISGSTYNDAISFLRKFHLQRKKDVLYVGLNAALQKTLTFDHAISHGDVHRAREMKESVGGKGQQCARAASNFHNILNTYDFGNESHTLPVSDVNVYLAQFLGGNTGLAVEEMMKSSYCLKPLTQWSKSNTRTCITVIECLNSDTSNEVKTTATELIEPSGTIMDSERISMLNMIDPYFTPQTNLGCMAICGTYPPGIDDQFYCTVAQKKDKDTMLVLDGWKGIQKTLDCGAVNILRMNVQELCAVANEISSHSLCEIESPITSRHECLTVAAASSVFLKYQIDYLAVTDGGSGAYLFTSKSNTEISYHIITLPFIVVKNPIGAGDTVTAVMSCLLADGCSTLDSFKWGLAAGTASCLRLGGADYFADDMIDCYCGLTTDECLYRLVDK